MEEIELERTYLAKEIPTDIDNFEYKEMCDYYIPNIDNHPHTRIRKKGEKYSIEKKRPVDESDFSKQLEETIEIDSREYDELSKNPNLLKVKKKRYFYIHNEIECEIDVFQDEFEGLIVIDFEFIEENVKDSFELPDFCLVEVTQERFIAGGALAGKKYEDIEEDLNRFNYKKL